jgi:ubiquinone/menaquinone biosynthesis C-methylase UbiE
MHSLRRSFEQLSYEAHAREYVDHVCDGTISSHAATWFRADTVGAWIQRRLRETVTPLIRSYPGAHWLTIGDGNGSDARFLQQHGVEVLATDISTPLLEVSYRDGLLKAYAKENAEHRSFAPESFDIVHCKEAYHHFPRPYLALYEMLRVAREAVVLIEPADSWIEASAVARGTFAIARRFLGKHSPKHSYETIGNYQYTLSLREMEKVAVGMNFPAIAYMHLNSFYRSGVETAPLSMSLRSPAYLRACVSIWLKNVLCRLGLIPPGLIAVIVFKRAPQPHVIADLKSSGFHFERLPENPYLR